jgi:DNA-binding response OmpR family regulator
MNILVVDDCPNIANYVAHVLSIHGHNVLALNHPAEALEHAEMISFDLAYLGIVMPSMSGFELGIRIRKLLPHCAVILGSEDVPPSEIIRFVRHGFGYLSAPFELEDLLSEIRRLCANGGRRPIG